MEGFRICALSDALRLALLADGKEVRVELISNLLKDAAFENQAELLDDDDFLPTASMFLIFADFSDLLGRALGHEIEPEGFALDWAEDYPQLRRACMRVQAIVVETMCAAGRQFKQAHGFDPGDVFTRMLTDDTTPEIAAAQLEKERNHLTIH